MNTANVSPISADAVAAKLEQIANFEQPDLFDELAEQPRLAEVLWFLQYVSHPENYAGGLTRFCFDFINEAAASLGTSEMMLVCGSDDHAPLTFDQARSIYHELPSDEQNTILPARLRSIIERDDAWEDEFTGPTESELAALNEADRAELLAVCELDKASVRTREAGKLQVAQMFTRARLLSVCKEAATKNLAGYFKRLCEQPNVTFRRRGSRDWHNTAPRAPWYFVNVADVLLAFIDRRKAALASRIAETEITRQVFEWMNVAQQTGRGVLIEGNTRFGKTEAIKLWCDMNPGVARLVNTPATNALGDLLREVARALGIEYRPGRLRNDLRERIDYVLRFSRLLLCFDEANLLLPGSYSKNTAPARLNWVRRSVVDRKTPAVFVHTPQNNAPAKKRFVKTTGYEMAQFDERIFTITLPIELSEADLIAVARIHFPRLQELHLKYVVCKALATERNYVSDIEKIATLANYKAKSNGRAVPLLADINAAIANVLPTARAAVQATPVAAPGALIAQPARNGRGAAARRIAKPLREPCTAVAAPLQSSRITFIDSAERAEDDAEELAKT